MNRHFEKFLLVGFLLAIAVLGSTRFIPTDRSAPVDPASVTATVANAIEPSPEAVPSAPQAALAAPPSGPKAPFLHQGTGPVPALKVQAAVLADLETGETYLEISSEERWPLASITKLMTASYAAERIDLSRPIVLASRDFVEENGDMGKVLKPGEAYLGRDLVNAMLMFSSNEAGEALANAEGRLNFLLGMNALAKAWDLEQTNFSDPTGLSASNQSTAKDLVRLAQHVYRERPELFAITRSKDAALRELTTGARIAVGNNNVFAGRPDFIGGKTGFTDEARGNLLSVFSVGGRPVIIVVLGTADRFGETEKLFRWFRTNFIAQS